MSFKRSYLEQFCYELANDKLSMNAKIRKDLIRLNNELYDNNTVVKAIDRDAITTMILIYKKGKIADTLKIKDKSYNEVSIQNKHKILVNKLYVYEVSEWLYKYIKKLDN